MRSRVSSIQLPFLATALALAATACGSDGARDRASTDRDDAGSSDASSTTQREQECADVNAKLEAEVATLRACEVAADCGKQLPTIGSCGCTHDLVGRSDADTTELTALFEQRGALSDVKGCETLSGTCDCPQVGGVTCTGSLCNWVQVAADDPCAMLEGSYASNAELECGLGPNGPVPCHWALTFTTATFSWQHSDVGESGSYACRDGAITASTSGATSYQGTVSSDGTLLFDGQAYTRKP